MCHYQFIHGGRLSTGSGYRQLGDMPRFGVKHTYCAGHHLGEPDAALGVRVHRENLHIRLLQVVELCLARVGVKAPDSAAGEIAEPDSTGMGDGQAVWQSLYAWTRRRDWPELYLAAGRVQNADTAATGTGKPEVALSIELQVLWPDIPPIAFIQREDLEVLRSGIKTADIIGVLLDIPDMAFRADGDIHDAIVAVWHLPRFHRAGIGIDAAQTISVHLSNP